jgi:hypothetical protein
MTPWSISIKTVGGDISSAAVAAPAQDTSRHNGDPISASSPPDAISEQKPPAISPDADQASSAIKPIPSLFTLNLDSESPLSDLNASIDNLTGLKPYQQRLIYRGRILPLCEREPSSTSKQRQGSLGVANSTTSDSVHPNQSELNSNTAAASAAADGDHGDDQPKCIRICDIQGLEDGHTIHLVPRRNATKPTSHANDPASADPASSTSNNNNGAADDDGGVDNSTASNLLSAILGLGGATGWSTMTSEDGGVTIVAGGGGGGVDEDLTTLGGLSALIGRSVGDGTTTAARRSMLNSRNSRLQRSRARAANTVAAARGLPSPTASVSSSSRGQGQGSNVGVPHRRQRGYRDGVPPLREAGSLEPVRQGMMTMNTVLGAHHDVQGGIALTADTSSKRTFYKGQWVDVKDTVNQWLEATILDIATPSDVLGKNEFHNLIQQELNDTIVHEDERKEMLDNLPIVSATEMEGRRQLLLTSTPVNLGPPGSPRPIFPLSLNDSIDTATTPPPPSPVESLLSCSTDVQLLKIHYNGWPHRWDEWIRSDSHRIRPFRTRTRHSSSVPYASPNIHSTYDDSPLTFIRSERDEALEREAVIPELSAVLAQTNDYVRRVAESLPVLDRLREENAANGSDSGAAAAAANADLERSEINRRSVSEATSEESDDGDAEEAKEPEPEVSLHPRDERLLPWQKHASAVVEDVSSNEATATTTHPNNGSFVVSSSAPRATTRQDLQGMASLLDRLGRTLTDIAPHIAALAATLPEEAASLSENQTSPAETTTALELAGQEESAQANDASRDAAVDGGVTSSEGRVPNPSSNSDPNMPLLVSLRDAIAASQAALQEQRQERPDESIDFINGMVHARSASGSSVAVGGAGHGSSASGDERRPSRTRNSREAMIASLLAGHSTNGSATLAALANATGNSNGSNNRAGDNGAGNDDGTESGGGGRASIDVHFHTVITPPGFGAGGIVFGGGGLAGMLEDVELPINFSNGNNTTGYSNSNLARNIMLNQPEENEDDMGLFDGLYGEPDATRNNDDDPWSSARRAMAEAALMPAMAGLWGPQVNPNEENASQASNNTNNTLPPLLNPRDYLSSDEDTLPPLLDRRNMNNNESSDDDDSDDGPPPLINRRASSSSSDIDSHPVLLSRGEYSSSSDDNGNDEDVIPLLLRHHGEDFTLDEIDSETRSEHDPGDNSNSSRRPSGSNFSTRPDTVVLDRSDEDDEDDLSDSMPPLITDPDVARGDNAGQGFEDSEDEALPPLVDDSTSTDLVSGSISGRSRSAPENNEVEISDGESDNDNSMDTGMVDAVAAAEAETSSRAETLSHENGEGSNEDTNSSGSTANNDDAGLFGVLRRYALGRGA